MTAEATRHLIAQGVRLMGIDAITFDPPVWAMFEGKHFWEAHRVMMDEDYWHLENLMNLEQLPLARVQAVRVPDQVDRDDGRARAGGRDPRGLSDGALVWFDDAACRDVRVAGGKGASLAAMTAAGLPVPPGFVVAGRGARAGRRRRAPARARARAGSRGGAGARPRGGAAASGDRRGLRASSAAGRVAVRSSRLRRGLRRRRASPASRRPT